VNVILRELLENVLTTPSYFESYLNVLPEKIVEKIIIVHNRIQQDIKQQKMEIKEFVNE